MSALVFPSSCVIGPLEQSFDRWFSSNQLSESILLDMSLVEYIEVASMVYLITMIDALNSTGVEVQISLPKSERIKDGNQHSIGRNVRDILRLWRFPQALKKVTGKAMHQFTITEDIVFFGEASQDMGEVLSEVSRNDKGLANLISKNYLSIVHFPFNNDIAKNSSTQIECDKWDASVVKGILKKYLEKCVHGHENMLPSRIVWECMSNATKHSNAENLLTGAFFDTAGKVFTLTYWDDGISIINTLKSELEQGNPIYRVHQDYSDVEFSFVTKTDGVELETKKVVKSNDIPTNESKLTEILLSSFFPGVSRNPNNRDITDRNPYTENSLPGMGLPTLLNAAVSELGGTIAVRTNKFFLNISMPKVPAINNADLQGERGNGNVYKAKLREFKNLPSFKGNMITIRLPYSNFGE